jgi:hypothetical protein
VVLAEPGREESIDVLIAEMSALFDHCLRQAGQRRELAVLRSTTITDGLDIRWIDAFLESESRMERHGPWAVVGHRIGEEDGLDLRFREAATMDVPEQTDEAVDQNRRGRDRADEVRDHAERRLQLQHRRLRAFRGVFMV